MKKEYNAQEALSVTPESEEKPMGVVESLNAETKGKELSPKMKKELEGYKTLLTKLMHSKETRGTTMKMLQGPAQVSVPMAAITINAQAEGIMKEKGIDVSQDVKIMGSVLLVSDLIELGNASGKWERPIGEEEMKLIYQDTLQDYIEKGIQNGTIDPIELQQQTEPLMNQNQREVGTMLAQKGGVPMELTQQQMIGNQRGVLQSRQGGKG